MSIRVLVSVYQEVALVVFTMLTPSEKAKYVSSWSNDNRLLVSKEWLF